ncbi:TauD/TfdA dioxygenase family protein [Paraburkholderia sp. J67]|uniref:TauD/TfdA dioxygenase family protein n=1 Tax=Paraburkholderia sp. J67 TaxID=2805435 RepID=UPI002ABD4621|nr:TauD/TfdA family dioxygenase [Paraburkholderia sp. J67]
MRIERLTCTLGAELGGVNLGDAARDAGLFGEIKALLLEHKVLFLRDQAITRAEHVAFARRFGALEDHPVAGSDPDHPGLVQIYRSDVKENYENSYHTDGSWRACPPMGAVLRCIECPEVGGDTVWIDMAAAYRHLPDEIKQRIGGLRAKHSIEHSFGAAMTPEARAKLAADNPMVEHPVVRTHPETGEKILYVNSFATHFANFHTPENVRFGLDKTPGASQLLNYLISQAWIPEYQVRFRWTPGSVVIWDNRSTQHYAVHDYWPAPRRMERTAIVGDRPF